MFPKNQLYIHLIAISLSRKYEEKEKRQMKKPKKDKLDIQSTFSVQLYTCNRTG